MALNIVPFALCLLFIYRCIYSFWTLYGKFMVELWTGCWILFHKCLPQSYVVVAVHSLTVCTLYSLHTGRQPAHWGADLACWAIKSAMDFIGELGEATQQSGHILDLTFSNIPFAQSGICYDMQSGSDHETQVTMIPGHGSIPLEQVHYWVPEAELGKLARLVGHGIARLTNPWERTNKAHLDTFMEAPE